jgi:hypothetical protein
LQRYHGRVVRIHDVNDSPRLVSRLKGWHRHEYADTEEKRRSERQHRNFRSRAMNTPHVLQRTLIRPSGTFSRREKGCFDGVTQWM